LKGPANKPNFKSVLTARIEEVFSSYESLNLSFFSDGNFKKKITDTDPRLDFGCIDQFYELVDKINLESRNEKDSLYACLRKSLVY
jgi:hypothetical protein